MPSEVIWSYFVGSAVFATGLAALSLRGDWQKARGVDRLLVLGPLFYAAPLAAFGTEHFTQTKLIASFVPAWIPWHQFWAYFVGACFVAAPFSLVTGIRARLSSCLLALAFFLFVVLMDAPFYARHPQSRFALALTLRQLSFSGGALALAATLTAQRRERGSVIMATIARYFVAVPVLFYSVEQFLHGDYVPAIPLNRLTPAYVYGHGIWTYLTAVVYAVAGPLLLVGKKTRAAATFLGLTVLFVELVAYVPIGIVEHGSLIGLNFAGDTLMYCGAVLLLANAMPRETERHESEDLNVQATRQLLDAAYAAFNRRDIDGVLALMRPDVNWPNGMEGGRVHGRDEVRAYWKRQWAMLNPHVEPARMEADETGNTVVNVHQVVRDLFGNILTDQIVQHVYSIQDGLIARMDIRKPDNGSTRERTD
jgi:uncharacterized membrane protein YphA (DoxX/SURF4 family)